MPRLRMDPRLYIFVAVLVFLIPLKWLIAWVAAVAVHELFHFVLVKLCGGKIQSFTVGFGGANMECAGLSNNAYLLSLLAGPVGGLALVFLGEWFPRVAICSWILSVYNLLPILPLDGGQALRILLKNNVTFHILQKIVLFVISALAVYLCLFMNLGPLPMVIAISLWIRNRKIPCKETYWGVQ